MAKNGQKPSCFAYAIFQKCKKWPKIGLSGSPPVSTPKWPIWGVRRGPKIGDFWPIFQKFWGYPKIFENLENFQIFGKIFKNSENSEFPNRPKKTFFSPPKIPTGLWLNSRRNPPDSCGVGEKSPRTLLSH